MNDPNGLVFFDGEYHLFYQHNPFGDRVGAHELGPRRQPRPAALEAPARRPARGGRHHDLLRQRRRRRGEHQRALRRAPAGRPAWSRSTPATATASRRRTSPSATTAAGPGRSTPATRSSTSACKDFRDPKVFWHEPTRRWVMVARPGRRSSKVRLFGSPDLKRWETLSDFGPAGATGGVWECPDLFPLPVDGDAGDARWVLDVDLNPGGQRGRLRRPVLRGHASTASAS